MEELEKKGKVCIEPINRNSQGEENGFGLYEGKSRDLFRKWGNVKHISESKTEFIKNMP